MAVTEIHVGDIGTALTVVFHNNNGSIKDISGASSIQIILEKPDDTVDVHTATLTTDGTDGYAHYTTTSVDDLDIAGWWWIQGYLEEGSSSKHHSNRAKFQVFPNLN